MSKQRDHSEPQWHALPDMANANHGSRKVRVNDPCRTQVLVECAKAGDRASFGELVKRFSPMVHGLAMSFLANAADADDVSQEVFVQALVKLDQLRHNHRFAGWLRQIAARMAINYLNRRVTMGNYQEAINVLPDDGLVPDGIDQKELRMTIREAVDGLPEPYRTVLQLRYYADWRHRQIAAAIDRPVKSVRVLCVRGVRLLKRKLVKLTNPGYPVPSPSSCRNS